MATERRKTKARRDRDATNVRGVASSFVGREEDVSALAAHLEEGRIVTVIGPGGMGKTRLALRFAEQRVAAYSAHRGGGVWFCDLSEARNVADVVSTVAAALSVKLDGLESDDEISEATGRAIARRGRVLLVLDNFDRITAAAPATVGLWLRAAPSARFLVTSRVPLDVMGERLWPLSPLAPDDAIELFSRRAGDVTPSFDPAAARAAVASIVDAIDRIPLAIELAASRLAILSLPQLRDRLARSLDLLSGRREVGRHASMRLTVLDSIELLGSDITRLFAACSVMRNGFTLEAAEAVLAEIEPSSTRILEGLEALARNSLLRVDHSDLAAARYSFFEAIREVAEEKLDSKDREAMELRHVSFYAALARRLRGAAVGLELENLLHAHSTAVARAMSQEAMAIALGLEPLLSARGLSRLRLRLFDGALEALSNAGAPNDAPRIAGLLARGFARRELGDSEDARVDFESALAMAHEANELSLAGVAMTRLGEMSDLVGQTSEAQARFHEALALLRRSENGEVRTLREAEAYLRLGHALRREGELAPARDAIVEAVERYRAADVAEGTAWALYELAVIEMFGGVHEAAFAHFDEGLRVARRGAVRVVFGQLKTARGCLLQDLGKLDEALDHHAEAARIFQEVGSRYREASALYYLATTYLERGDFAESEPLLRRAAERLDGVGAARYEALMAGCLASALAALGRKGEAEHAMSRAERAAALVASEPALLANVRIHRLALDLREREFSNASATIAEAEALVRASPTDDSRFALRALRAATRGGLAAHEGLVVLKGGAGFRAPGVELVVLPERSPLRRILEHFARRRIEAPGEVVGIEDVIRAGWPGERIGTDAALNRGYVALASLRKLGLRGFILHGAGGYLLSQAVVVRIEARA